jgi:uncharacterized membrane protein YphA (DoxX/SURF4 family)
MSTPNVVDPRPDDLARPIRQLLPVLALFLRVSIGLAMLNSGLMGLFTKNNGGNPFANPALGRLPTFPAGLDGLTTVLPYAELALSVGLIFGVFTTITALLACAVSLINPLLTTVALVSSAGIGPGMNPMVMGLNGIAMLLPPNQFVVAYMLLVALSPLSINRFSVDALMFERRTLPLPQPGVTPEPQDVTETPK